MSAIQVTLDGTGARRMGLLTEITPDPGLHVCGPGFNEQTVQVKFGGIDYFVFRQDLDLRLRSTEKKQ